MSDKNVSYGRGESYGDSDGNMWSYGVHGDDRQSVHEQFEAMKKQITSLKPGEAMVVLGKNRYVIRFDRGFIDGAGI